jgi:hypothetical protein
MTRFAARHRVNQVEFPRPTFSPTDNPNFNLSGAPNLLLKWRSDAPPSRRESHHFLRPESVSGAPTDTTSRFNASQQASSILAAFSSHLQYRHKRNALHTYFTRFFTRHPPRSVAAHLANCRTYSRHFDDLALTGNAEPRHHKRARMQCACIDDRDDSSAKNPLAGGLPVVTSMDRNFRNSKRVNTETLRTTKICLDKFRLADMFTYLPDQRG